ncbi:MAG: GAF domain-containing sensor histidine kinase [Deltaproteobacteria bacterium]|nr:GAF domain-containing sensor histidine kinase [Deltaproteobacteria bacterium]
MGQADPHHAAMSSGISLVEEELIANQAWLIALRWWAGLGVVAATWFTVSFLDYKLNAFAFYTIGLAMLVYNLFLFAILKIRLMVSPRSVEPFKSLALAQISLDWSAMILLIHYSGGVESPAILFFFFHVIIASILRSSRQTYMYSAVAIVLVGGMTALEYTGLLPHHGVIGFANAPMYKNGIYILGVMAFFISGIFIAAFIASTLNSRLRQRQAEIIQLTDQLQRAFGRLQSLYDGMRALNSTLDLQQVLDRLAHDTAEVMGVRGCSIRLLDKPGERLTVAAVHGLSDSYMHKGDLVLAHNPLACEVLAGKTITVGDVALEDRLQYGMQALEEGIRSTLTTRLQGRREVLGMIRAYSTEVDHFTEDDVSFLDAIANQSSLAIENAMTFKTLAEMDETKSKFMLTITHELRSPIGVVRSLLCTITSGYAGAPTDLQADIIRRALQRVDFLQTLIDDLLDLASGKSESAQAQAFVDLPLADAVGRVITRFELPAKEKRIELKWRCETGDSSSIVSATGEDIDRILNNLVSNAIKYTSQGGSVTVTLDCVAGEAHLRISDTGMGIPDEAMPRLFEEFYRAPNARAHVKEGTGLGLAITKNLVTRFGGRIVIKSKVGEGTECTVVLPLKK